MKCKHSFIAYIDESGDDAINKHGDKNGSSKWFVISALIVRASRDMELVKVRNNILQKLPTTSKELHMTKLKKSEYKSYVAQEVSKIPARCVSVISNKYSIINSKRKDLFDAKNTYYNYMSRYLIERISWCCSHLRKDVKEGNGKVKIVFSKRGGMSYSDFKLYLEKMKKDDLEGNKDEKTRINWNVIDIDCIDAKAHSEWAGLQLADVVTYSFFKSVNRNDFNMVDTTLVQMFKKNTFKLKENYIGCGVKIVPNLDKIPESEYPKELIDVFKSEK